MTPTDDKRLDEVRERWADNGNGPYPSFDNAPRDIAFLLEKIAEYEAREGAPEPDSGTAQWRSEKLIGFGDEGPIQIAAPPPQVREAESVERMACGHERRYWVNFGDCTDDLSGVVIPNMSTCVACQLIIKQKHVEELEQRERTEREDGVKAGLKAASEVFKCTGNKCRFTTAAYSFTCGSCSARLRIESLPFTEIAGRKD